MADTKDTANAKATPEKSGGPHTPYETPVFVGDESGGEYNFNRGRATPYPQPAKAH